MPSSSSRLPLVIAFLSAGCAYQERARELPYDLPPPSPSPDDGGGGPVGPPPRALHCPPARSLEALPQRQAATAARPRMTFEDLRLALTSSCGGCHKAPTETGGFTFQSQYMGSEIYVGSVRKRVAGLYEAGPAMAMALRDGKMPPKEQRMGNDAFYRDLGNKLDLWIAAGRPNADFELPPSPDAGQRLPPEIAAAMTDLGDCIPDAESIGKDRTRDDFFAAATALPPLLSDTDLFTLDAYALGQSGTVAYDVEYPLWADNAHKGRWIHVPAGSPVTFTGDGSRFEIPDNTRFYKTFFKLITQLDGSVRYRKIETRLIVVRHAPRTPLFGTYVWDENESSARLHAAPYRSGDPFKDSVFTYERDERTHTRRTYALPAKHRCNECHQGSESDSFILGFVPLQLHRRGAGPIHGEPAPDEMSQPARLLDYGVIAGGTAVTALPVLESSSAQKPRNDYELRVQAYLEGNCGHCHNPKGFATRQNPALRLNFLAGGNVFQFPPSLASVYPQGGNYISPGNAATSVIYKRVANQTKLEGLVPLMHMPLHTPSVDCNFVTLVGKWITSIPASGSTATPEDIAKALAAADRFQSTCVAPDDVTWLEEDFTEPPIYAPRRADWNDAKNGIPDSIRKLELTPEVLAVASTPIANGYWVTKAACTFPVLDAPPGGVRPWMLKPDGTPKRPFGEIYYQTPGEAYFNAVCQKCHGPRANGDSGIAKTILYATGGQTRVANLIEGLFGKHDANLKLFDVTQPDGSTRNLAGNYLIWMASGGTQAYFPPELEPIVGKNGGNMLNLVRQTCGQLLPGHPNQLVPDYQIYETYANVCTLGNPITPELGFKPGTTIALDEAKQNAWLDTAARNAGWMIFRFFRDQASQGQWPIGQGECEKRATTFAGGVEK